MNKSDLLVGFGLRIQEKRMRKSLSQEEFAAIVGVHRTYIGMIERAEKNVTILTVIKLAQALETSMSELLEGL